MTLSFNKDDENVGTVSERLSAKRDSPSKLCSCSKIYTGYLTRPCYSACNEVFITGVVLGTWDLSWFKGELMQIISTYSFKMLIFTIHFISAIGLEHAIFNILRLEECEYVNCSENKSER